MRRFRMILIVFLALHLLACEKKIETDFISISREILQLNKDLLDAEYKNTKILQNNTVITNDFSFSFVKIEISEDKIKAYDKKVRVVDAEIVKGTDYQIVYLVEDNIFYRLFYAGEIPTQEYLLYGIPREKMNLE